jgi:hypothetical protein
MKTNSNCGNQRIGFHEKQEALLCGKHALNNVLQEEKLSWIDIDEPIIGLDIMNTNSKINLFDLCKLYEDDVKSRGLEQLVPIRLKTIKDTLSGKSKPIRNNVDKSGKPTYGSNSSFKSANDAFKKAEKEYKKKYAGKTDEELIEMIKEETDYFVSPDETCNTEVFGEHDNGMLPINIYPKILGLLSYNYKMVYEPEEGINDGRNIKTRVLEILEDELSKPNCLGAVINVPNLGGHWTAIVKYRKNCITLSHSRGEPMYAYADSLLCSQKSLEDVKTSQELKDYLESKVTILGAVFIYEKADGSSYVSQAQKNRDAMNNNPLNKIKIDGGKRKSRKNMKKTKRSKTRRNK